MNKTTCLLLGVRLNRYESSIDDWYLYEETHDTNLSYGYNEGSQWVYIGLSLATSYDCNDTISKMINTDDFIYLSDSILEELRKAGLDYSETDIKLYFFDYWG